MSIEDLKSLMEPGRVVEDQEVIRTYIDDWTGRYKGSTSAVTFPHSTDEVAKILSWCSTNQVRVVPVSYTHLTLPTKRIV